MILNLGSLYLGLLAWGLGFAAIARKGRPLPIFSSLAACSTALLLQLMEIQRRIAINDLAAVEDTIDAVILAVVVLLALTIFLNLVALLRGRK